MLRVTLALSAWRRNREFGPERLDGHTFIFVAQGRAFYRIGEEGRRVEATRGTFMWLPHRTRRHMVTDEQGFHQFAVRFKVFRRPSAALPVDTVPDLASVPEVAQIAQAAHVENLFRTLERTWIQRAPYYEVAAAGSLMTILGAFLQARVRSEIAPHLEGIVGELTSYLAANYHRSDLSLRELTERSGYSDSYLIRFFRQNTGETPMEYLRKLRLNVSLDLLASGEFSVKEVAERVGFQDPYYFSRIFARVMGIPPSQLARECRQTTDTD